jgi:hypothetical protein
MVDILNSANQNLPQPPQPEEENTATTIEEYAGEEQLDLPKPLPLTDPNPEELATSEYRLPGQMTGLGYLPVSLEKKPPLSPALTGEVTKTLQDMPFTGAGFTTQRENVIDKSKVQNIVTVKEAYDAAGISQEVYEKKVLNASGFLARDTTVAPDADGNYPMKRFSFAPLGPASFAEREKLLNSGQALSLEYTATSGTGEPIRSTVAIPFDKITEQWTKQPEELDLFFEQDLPFIEKDSGLPDIFVSRGSNKETLDAAFAMKFVEYFRKQGMSERNIAGVLKHRISLKQLVPALEGTPFGSAIAYGDKSLLVGSATEALRFGADAVTWMVGEGFEALTLWNAQLNLEGIGGYNLSTPQGREALYDRWLPRQAGIIQDHYDSVGLDVTYAHAEQLSRFFSSPTTALATIAIQEKAAGTLSRFVIGLRGAKEQQRFKIFANDMQKKYKDITPEDIIMRYKAKRKQEVDTPLGSFSVKSDVIHDKILKVPLLGVQRGIAGAVDLAAKPIAAINGFRTTSALKAGFQLEDAALQVGKRNEVNSFIRYRNSKRRERMALRNKIDQSGKPASIQDQERLDELTRQIDRSRDELRKITALSEVPAFMRTSTSLDASIILGGAAGNIIGQNYGGDAMLWEFIGSMTGMGLYGMSNAGSAFIFVKDMLRGRKDLGVGSGDFMALINAVRLGKNMRGMDEDFVAGVMARVEYFDGLSQELVGKGVPSQLTMKSAAGIMKLSILQTLEEGMRMNLDAPGTAQFSDAMAELQNIKNASGELVAELRILFERLGQNAEARTEGSGVKKLYDTIEAALENANAKNMQLEADLDFLQSNGEEIAKAIITGTEDGLAHSMSENAYKNMPDVISRLKGENITFINPQDASAMRERIITTSNSFAAEITAKLTGTIRDILPSAYRTKTTAGDIFTDAKTQKALPLYEKPHDLFALGVENAYSTAHQQAALPYKELNGQVFKLSPGPSGQRVTGVATADGGNLLDQIFIALGKDTNLELLKAMSPDAVNASKMNKLVGTLNNSAKGVLINLAAKRGVEVEDFIESVQARAGDNLAKNVPLELAVVKFMRDENLAKGRDVEVFPLDFLQIKEAKEGLGQLAFRAGKAGNTAAESDYYKLQTATEETLNNFSVTSEDGTRMKVFDLFATVTTPDGRKVEVPVREALRIADAGWSEFNNRFRNGNPLISKWMGTDTFKGEPRVFRTPSPDHPGSMTYGDNPPITWLDVQTWSSKNSGDATKDFGFLKEAMGTLQEDGTRKIDLRTEDGKFVKESLAATYREWLLGQIENGQMTFKQFDQLSTRYEQIFTGIDEAGNEVPLLDTKRIFREFTDIYEESVGELAFNNAQKQYKKVAEENAKEVTRQVSLVKRGVQTSVDFLQRFSPENIDARKAASVLIEGGPERIAVLKKHLKETAKMSDEEVTEVLRAVITDAMENAAFTPTGTFTANTGAKGITGATRLTPDYDLNLPELRKLLGLDNRDVAQAVEEAVGADAYKTYMSVLAFLSEEQTKLDNRIRFTGIPRSFSVESYISRFYAINRGVVSFRYVGTEAVLQQMRNRNMSILTQIIQNPKVGEYFMEMVRTGKPLPFEKEKQLFQMLTVGLERYNATKQPEPVRIRTDTGHEFTMGAPTDALRVGRTVRSRQQLLEIQDNQQSDAQRLFGAGMPIQPQGAN